MILHNFRNRHIIFKARKASLNFILYNVRVIKTASGKLITAMPCETYTDKSTGNTVRKDLFHPVTNEARKAFEDAVLTAYDEAKTVASVSNSDE